MTYLWAIWAPVLSNPLPTIPSTCTRRGRRDRPWGSRGGLAISVSTAGRPSPKGGIGSSLGQTSSGLPSVPSPKGGTEGGPTPRLVCMGGGRGAARPSAIVRPPTPHRSRERMLSSQIIFPARSRETVSGRRGKEGCRVVRAKGAFKETTALSIRPGECASVARKLLSDSGWSGRRGSWGSTPVPRPGVAPASPRGGRRFWSDNEGAACFLWRARSFRVGHSRWKCPIFPHTKQERENSPVALEGGDPGVDPVQ